MLLQKMIVIGFLMLICILKRGLTRRKDWFLVIFKKLFSKKLILYLVEMFLFFSAFASALYKPNNTILRYK